LEFPEGVLFGEVEKGTVVPVVSGTQAVYNGQGQGVRAVASVGGSNLAVVTRYWGLSNTVYATNELAPTNAGVYGVEVQVAQSEQNYAGTTNVVLTIQRKGLVMTAGNQTIRAGGVFEGGLYTVSGLEGSDTATGNLTTQLRGTNAPAAYDSSQNQGGVYRILRGTAGNTLTNNYAIEYREGLLTVLKNSVLTEGTVMPLGAGQGFTLLVMSNRGVTHWGSTSLGALPEALRFGTTNFKGATGVGAGAGSEFGMAWTRDGQPVVWGSNNAAVTGMPAGLEGIIGMSGGANHVVYHREVTTNRTAGAWGTNNMAVTGVPTNGNAGVAGVAAGERFGLLLRTNGTVTAWGDGTGGATNVPASLSNAVGVAAGTYHGVALRSDGTVTSWGFPATATAVPEELTNRSSANFVRAVAVTAGGAGTLVLRADGSLRAWGNPASEPWRTNLPATGGTNAAVVAVSASLSHAVALRADGTVTAWGATNGAITAVPAGVQGLVPMGGPDSDGDGWANEAELRVGTDPLSAPSRPRKASFGVTFGYGTNVSGFETARTVNEGTNPVVGTLEILDTMGRRETNNQADMTVELGEESLKTFAAIDRTNRVLRFKTNPVFEGTLTNANNTYAVDVIVRDSPTAAPITTTLTVQVGNVAPQITGTTGFSVSENVAVGTLIGTLQASEANVTWSILSGNGLGLLTVDAASGQLSTAAPIDYEALADKTITLTVRITDTAGATASAIVTVTVNDVVEGITPDTWLPPGEVLTPQLLTKYAIGGAASPTAASVPPALAVANDTNGQPVLTLTALVRTDDPQLVVQAEVVGSLGNFGNTDQTTTVSGTPASDQSGVPTGFQRQTFTAPASSSNRQFIRLKVTR